MKTDIEIAQEAKIEPITSIAETLGITTDELELYGKYKAKLSEEYLEKLKGGLWTDGKEGSYCVTGALSWSMLWN